VGRARTREGSLEAPRSPVAFLAKDRFGCLTRRRARDGWVRSSPARGSAVRNRRNCGVILPTCAPCSVRGMVASRQKPTGKSDG
jgi:hypothetical protein